MSSGGMSCTPVPRPLSPTTLLAEVSRLADMHQLEHINGSGEDLSRVLAEFIGDVMASTVARLERARQASDARAWSPEDVSEITTEALQLGCRLFYTALPWIADVLRVAFGNRRGLMEFFLTERAGALESQDSVVNPVDLGRLFEGFLDELAAWAADEDPRPSSLEMGRRACVRAREELGMLIRLHQ